MKIHAAFKHLFYLLSTLLALTILLLLLMKGNHTNEQDIRTQEKKTTDLFQILSRGRLDVSLSFNSLSYYILHGIPSGFHYELVERFADYLNVELNIIIATDINEAIVNLLEEKTDIVCGDLSKTDGKFGNNILFTNAFASVTPVLVQRKEHHLYDVVKSIDDLNGKTIYIPRNTVFKIIIKNKTKHLVSPPVIVEVSEFDSERLIDAVAEEKISYTVAYEHIARFHAGIYTNLDISLTVGNVQSLAWCIRKQSPELLNAFNTWLSNYMKTNEFKYLYKRYYEKPIRQAKARGEYFSIKDNSISKYDEVIKKYSRKNGLDWRFVSALIYEESGFNHDLISYAGAYGIMQMMPETAEAFGIDSVSTVDEHIRAGIKFIRQLNDRFMNIVVDSAERIKFVLASYNVGEGHILDAIALASKYNKNPQIWNNHVEYFLIAKSQPKYYNDEVVRHGYSKGKMTSRFVKNVLERYEHYKRAFQ